MKPMNKETALVIFSGGQDSTTCLFWALKHFQKVVALTFTYGQKHIVEVEKAREIAAIAGETARNNGLNCGGGDVEWHQMDISFISQLSHNSLTDSSMEMDQEQPVGGVPNTFVPGRNLFFLSVAAVYARERGINHMVTGVGETDFSGYPDCRDAFIKSLNVTLNLAMDEQFVIHTPLMWIDKAKTWAMADELGVLDLVREYAAKTGKDRIDQNTLSLGFVMQYGKFRFWSGGDTQNIPASKKNKKDPGLAYEDMVGARVGQVTLCKMNHHGCSNAMSEAFVRAVRAQAYVSCIWCPGQVHETGLARDTSRLRAAHSPQPDAPVPDRSLPGTRLHEEHRDEGAVPRGREGAAGWKRLPDLPAGGARRVDVHPLPLRPPRLTAQWPSNEKEQT